MTGKRASHFFFLFSYAKNTTHIEKNVKLKRVNRAFKTLQMAKLLNPGLILKWTQLRQTAFLDFIRPRCWTLAWSWNELTLLTYGHIAESWPDLEMNSAQAAFLDFVRPRCWTLAWSWNELTLLTYGHVAESWPDLEMNSAQAAFLDLVRRRCWTLVWSWNELALLTYGHVVEPWPDLEMNSAQAYRLFRLRMATLLNPSLILKWTHIAEPWPDLEMNSAQVAFLDFVLPRCWILAWSWNELSSGSLFRIGTATLLNPGHDLEMNSAQWKVVGNFL